MDDFNLKIRVLIGIGNLGDDGFQELRLRSFKKQSFFLIFEGLKPDTSNRIQYVPTLKLLNSLFHLRIGKL